MTEIAAQKLTPEALEELGEAESRFSRLTKEVRSHEPGGGRRSLMSEWMRANQRSMTFSIASPTCRTSSACKGGPPDFSGPAVWAPADDHLDHLYERNQAEHRAIRQALVAGSVAGARELAHEHVMHSFELLTTILEHVGSDWAART